MVNKTAPSMFSIFRNRAFTMLWAGQLVSALGSSLTTLAASILVYRITGSALSVGLMLIATSGPTILVGLIAGVYVDRNDRKRILLMADLLRGLLIAIIPFLIQFNILWLYVIVALTSTITQFFDSAHASLLPETATDEELASANALMAVSSVGSTMIGFALAGLIVEKISVNWAFYLDAVSFGLSALLILFTRLPHISVAEDSSLGAIAHNLKAGLKVVANVTVLRSLFLIGIPIFLLFGFQNAILLPFAIKVLDGSEFEFGLQQAAEAVGITIGSLLMARLADRIREGQWLAISYLLMAVLSIWYSTINTIAMSIFLIGAIGIANAPSYIGRQLVIQRATPREMRGRVNSAFFVVRDVMFVLGMALSGLADIFDVRLLMLISSIALLGVAIIVLIMPGLGQPAAEWKRMLSLLRGVEAAPRLGAGRTAARSEVDRFIDHFKELSGMSSKERDQLAAQTLVAEARSGNIVTYRGETSNMAYFILKGSVGVGYLGDDEYKIVNYLREGDFFGEIAALTGSVRTANIITEADCEFLIIPAKVMRQLANRYAGLKQMFYSTMAYRLKSIELPHGISLDQNLLRELRTTQPDMKTEPASA